MDISDESGDEPAGKEVLAEKLRSMLKKVPVPLACVYNCAPTSVHLCRAV